MAVQIAGNTKYFDREFIETVQHLQYYIVSANFKLLDDRITVAVITNFLRWNTMILTAFNFALTFSFHTRIYYILHVCFPTCTNIQVLVFIKTLKTAYKCFSCRFHLWKDTNVLGFIRCKGYHKWYQNFVHRRRQFATVAMIGTRGVKYHACSII